MILLVFALLCAIVGGLALSMLPDRVLPRNTLWGIVFLCVAMGLLSLLLIGC